MFQAIWAHGLATLSALLMLAKSEGRQKKSLQKTIKKSGKMFGKFVQKFPGCYDHLHHLILAEQARLDGDHIATTGHYELALAKAKERGLTPLCGFVSERRLSFCLRNGQPLRAEDFRAEAISYFEAWGAELKAIRLREAAPIVHSDNPKLAQTIAGTISDSGSTGSGSTTLDQTLDFQSILSVSQQISEQVNLNGVLERVLAGVAENAGANRVLLCLYRKEALYAEAMLHKGTFVRVDRPLSERKDVAHTLVRLVERQRSQVVIVDALRDEALGSDGYVVSHRCRSMMGTPITRKGELVGIMLLENSLMPGAFTESRVKVVEVLSTQAAISLDNAQLYDDLEARVAARTNELSERNRAMRLVLDNVRQGFMTLNREGRISPERSAIVDRWFGNTCEGLFLSFLEAHAPVTAEWFELAWEEVVDGFMPLVVSVAQLPRRMKVQEQVFQIDWHPILDKEDEDELEGMLVVITDITAELAKEYSDKRAKEHLKIFQRITKDRTGFFEFYEECGDLVKRLADETAPLVIQQRWVHTLKGNCSIFGVESIAELCNQIEKDIEEYTQTTVTEAQTQMLSEVWGDLEELVQSLFSESAGIISITKDEYKHFLAQVKEVAPDLETIVLRWSLEPIVERFERLAEQARALGLRLGKGDIDIDIEVDDVRLDRETFGAFWSNMIHAIRNAVDHGFESQEERVAQGKKALGTLRFSCKLVDDIMRISLVDDGRGVDWEVVRTKAKAAGLPHNTHEELVDALCTEGITTREIADDISGRGIGMAALHRSAVELGGTIEVESEPNTHSSIHFIFPGHYAK